MRSGVSGRVDRWRRYVGNVLISWRETPPRLYFIFYFLQSLLEEHQVDLTSCIHSINGQERKTVFSYGTHAPPHKLHPVSVEQFLQKHKSIVHC